MNQNPQQNVADFAATSEKIIREGKGNEHWLLHPHSILPIVSADEDGKDTLGLSLQVDGSNEMRIFHPHPIAKRQLAEFADMPPSYFDLLAERNVGLLTRCVRDGLKRHKGSALKLARVNGDGVKSMLSHRFRVLDNDQVMELANMLVQEFNMEPGSCYLSPDGTLTVNILSRELQGDVGKVGEGSRSVDDILRFGIRLTNNENGGRSFSIKPLVYRLVCLNGMVLPSDGKAVSISHAGASYSHEVASALPLSKEEVNRVSPSEVLAKSMDSVGDILTAAKVQEVTRKIKSSRQRMLSVPSAMSRLASAVGRSLGITPSEPLLSSVAGGIAVQQKDGEIDLWKLVNLFTLNAQQLADVGLRAQVESKVHKLFSFSDSDLRRVEHDAQRAEDSEDIPLDLAQHNAVV